MAGMEVVSLLAISITCVEPHTAPMAFAGNLRAPLSRAWPLSSDPSGRSREFLEAAPRVASERPSPACTLRMSATGFDFSPGDKVVAKGQVGTLKTYESSWWTVALDGGGVVKSRPKDLALATADPAATKSLKARAKSPAPAKKKAASRAKTTATETATRSARAGKADDKPAGKRGAKKAAAKKAAAPAGPPKKAVISPALQRVLDLPTGSPPAASAPVSRVESVAKYPDALANVLDAMDSDFQPNAGVKTVAYPPGLSRTLGATGSAAVEKPAASYPHALADILDATEGTGVQGSGKSAVAYPPGLSRVLGATGSAAVDQAAVKYPGAFADLLDATEMAGAPGAKARAAPKKARSTVTKMKSSAAKSRGTDTKSKSSQSGIAYPPALQRYLDLSTSTTSPSLPTTSTGSPPFSTTLPRTKKPARAVYPEVLANLLQLASSTPVPEGSWRKRGAASKKSNSNTATKTRSAKTATSADNKPKSAKLPAALALVLDAAKDSVKLKMLAEVQAQGDAVAQYPEALAAYLDLVEMTGVPPSVPPPKRAT